MSAPPLFPFAPLLSQLSQATSVAGSPPVRHEVSSQRDAAQTGDDRAVWIPVAVEVVIRPFALPDGVTPDDQAWDFDVMLYGSSLARVADMHATMVGWLDLLIGPEQGCAPSQDASPAIMTGSVNLLEWLYPSTDLDGLSLTFVSPIALTVAMPAGPHASAPLLAGAINRALRDAGLRVNANLSRPSATERYLTLSADATSPDAPTLTLDPDAAGSACAALGLTSTPAVGAAPSMPYRPGYKVGKAEGPAGGTIDAGAWSMRVPVRLFAPIYSQVNVRAPILSVSSTVYAADDAGEDLAVSSP